MRPRPDGRVGRLRARVSPGKRWAFPLPAGAIVQHVHLELSSTGPLVKNEMPCASTHTATFVRDTDSLAPPANSDAPTHSANSRFAFCILHFAFCISVGCSRM